MWYSHVKRSSGLAKPSCKIQHQGEDKNTDRRRATEYSSQTEIDGWWFSKLSVLLLHPLHTWVYETDDDVQPIKNQIVWGIKSDFN